MKERYLECFYFQLIPTSYSNYMKNSYLLCAQIFLSSLQRQATLINKTNKHS